MRKTLSILLILILCLSFSGCKKNKTAIIGISQYSEHASLDNCRLGFIEGLKESGLIEETDFIIDYKNAKSNNANANSIAKDFVENKVDLMCAIATPSASACFKAGKDKNIPVVFNAISDPEKAKLTNGNITGVSDALPVDAQLKLIRALQPNAKKLGIIYTVSEPNSVSTIAEYKDMAGMFGFVVLAVGVSNAQEVLIATDQLISKKVDCFTNLTDNNVVSVLESILKKTDIAKIPVYGSEIEQVKMGCVAAAGIDYLALGKEAGKIAATIIKGEQKAEDIPYKTISEFETYINTNKLNSFKIVVPNEILENATNIEQQP